MLKYFARKKLAKIEYDLTQQISDTLDANIAAQKELNEAYAKLDATVKKWKEEKRARFLAQLAR